MFFMGIKENLSLQNIVSQWNGKHKKCGISSNLCEALQESDVMSQNDLLSFLPFSPNANVLDLCVNVTWALSLGRYLILDDDDIFLSNLIWFYCNDSQWGAALGDGCF